MWQKLFYVKKILTNSDSGQRPCRRLNKINIKKWTNRNTENQIGLLNRIAIIFSRRKINVESLNTSPTEVDSVHRFTIVINETEDVVKKLCRQIEKQVEVLKAYYNTEDEIVWQELALYKVSTDAIAEKVKVERLLRKYGARAVVIRKDYTVFEVSGQRSETDEFIKILEPYGLIEFVRSARVAIIKASDGFHKKLKEFEFLCLSTFLKAKFSINIIFNFISNIKIILFAYLKLIY